MATVDEVADGVFRITTFVSDFNLGFSQFVVRDDEPLLFHTGMNALFPDVLEAVATVIDPAALRWVGFSHFEADECGSLNRWLEVAPHAEPVCSLVGKLVSVDDFAIRPARPVDQEETFTTGTRRFRYLATPHVPHCWEAGVLFEETEGILFSSDILGHNGDGPPTTAADVIGPCRDQLVGMQAGPLADYLPYTARTGEILGGLAALEPRVIATMHGSVYRGDGAQAIRDYAGLVREILGDYSEPTAGMPRSA